MSESKEELRPEQLFKKWLFVPNFSGNIQVTDMFNGKKRDRNLRPSDFQYGENGEVPNYGMLTYVGIDQISKELSKRDEIIKVAVEALEEIYQHADARKTIVKPWRVVARDALAKIRKFF